MDKKYFKLNVPTGTRIVSSRGDYVVEAIPDNAFEYFAGGSEWLSLLPEATDVLAKKTEFELRKLIQLKERQGKDADVNILQKALSSANKPKTKKDERPKA